MTRRVRVPRELQAVLDASGLPWEARYGTRHIKILLLGRLVQSVSTSASESSGNRGGMNALACVRRAVRAALQEREVATRP